MNWLWLNIPLMAVFFLAVAGIPLWLVLRRSDFGARPADQAGQLPALVAARYRRPARVTRTEQEAWMRELAGASR